MVKNYPILEFDPAQEAIIDPTSIYPKQKLPEKVVITFFREIIAQQIHLGRMEEAGSDRSEWGIHRFYRMKGEFSDIGVFHPGVGAPIAAALLEAAIVMGGKYFIACGSAGILQKEAYDHLILPTAAIRDEGTSYHYMEPSSESKPSELLLNHIRDHFKDQNIPYLEGKTWTTDAYFRETKKKTAQRKNQGCLTVEMEAAAFFAVAQFRNVELAQLLYGSDTVVEGEWNGIEKKPLTRERLFWLTVDLLKALK